MKQEFILYMTVEYIPLKYRDLLFNGLVIFDVDELNQEFLIYEYELNFSLN